MLSEELKQKIKQIHISTSYLVNESMAGEYASAFKGRGMEFEEVREYAPGDDIRNIDWNVTARKGTAYVKEFREERELTLFLMVDMSGSGKFGSTRKLKTEVMAEVAAILAYLASRNNDKVGMMLFTEEVEKFVPPKKGRGHIWRLIQEILTFEPKAQGTHISGALEFAGHLLRKKSVLFLISDFIDDSFERSLVLASKRHDMTAVRVYNPFEMAFPSVGLVELEDPETGMTCLVDTSNQATRNYFEKESAKQLEESQSLLRKMGLDEVVISTEESTVEPLMKYFRRRDRKK